MQNRVVYLSANVNEKGHHAVSQLLGDIAADKIWEAHAPVPPSL